LLLDSRPPYASGEQRLRLLYRLAMTGQEQRVLVIGTPAAATAAFELDAMGRACDVVPPGAAVATSAFDAVALPGGLMDLLGQRPPQDQAPAAVMLRQALDAVRPGGIVVGHFDHLSSAHGLRRTLRGQLPLGTWIKGRALMSGARCLQTLKSHGFAQAECFYVEPQISAPMALIPVHPLAARGHFLRAIRRTRGQYSSLGFAARMALAACGLGGALQPQLFFWARRAC
jgi:hypothetical protein